ncbi:MAG TPA: class I SAM-dependent methyltransferase [Polyangia bacterium]|jgi:SAM-dependent methyltransferase|nr:class I SAM-dependent methyltransferase [Polyangia bacterium]
MTVAKPPERPLPPSTLDASEDQVTPEPIHIEVTAEEPGEEERRQRMDSRTAWAQSRPTPPSGVSPINERSGPIGISDGEFTTPTVRKRVTTQPRGISALPGAPAPPPVATGDGRGATPQPQPPEYQTEIEAELPFDETDDQLLALADEAARTPPPVAQDMNPTPPPAVTPPAVMARTLTPRPPTVARAATPPPPPWTVTADASLAAAPAPASVLPEIEDADAVPAGPLSDGDSGANISPLAQTLAHIAEAARQHDPLPEHADEVATDDEVEVVDAPMGALKLVAPSSERLPKRGATPPPLPMGGTPPPIPGGRRVKTSAEILSALPEALAQRPRRLKRSKPWYEEVFDEDYLRTLPFMSPGQTLKEVAFIEESLQAPPGADLLDVGCGYGRHAIELVQRGVKVTGLDLSLPLLIRAADEAQRRAVSVNFVHADMREMAFERQFDGAYCMLTSFGYFDEDANLRVAEGVARALKPGGRFLLDVVNRDYLVGDLPTRIWWEGSGCVVLEEVDFNFHTSRVVTRRSVVFDDGRQLEQEISVRAYSLHELGRLLRQAGFRVLDISGSLATRGHFFGSTSRNLLILSEKRSEER